MDVGDFSTWSKSVADWPWSEIKSAIWLLLYFSIVFAVFGCLRKLGTIRQIIHDFIEARGPIWDLRSTLKLVETVPPTVQSMKEQIDRLEATIAATRRQMADWQIESASARTDAAPEPEPPTAAGGLPPDHDDDEANWEKLRDYWRRNTERLEYVIEQITDGRSRLPFDRLPRTNYAKIINRLEARGYISPAAAEASRELNALFNAYRPRNTRVRAEMLGPLQQLDLQLDKELVPYALVQRSDNGETSELNGVGVVPPTPEASATRAGGSGIAAGQLNGGRPAPTMPEDHPH